MGTIEILALIVAIAALLKLIILVIAPQSIANISAGLLEKPGALKIIYLIILLITGYLILQEFTIVQIMAVSLPMLALVGFSIMAYSGSLAPAIREDLAKPKGEIFKKNWLPIIIWIVVSVWAIYEIVQ